MPIIEFDPAEAKCDACGCEVEIETPETDPWAIMNDMVSEGWKFEDANDPLSGCHCPDCALYD